MAPSQRSAPGPGAKYIELPGCGHCPPLEQPEAFLKAIGKFVGL
jgi:pimeloyl-ACP methyl ester carboxylesterase